MLKIFFFPNEMKRASLPMAELMTDRFVLLEENGLLFMIECSRRVSQSLVESERVCLGEREGEFGSVCVCEREREGEFGSVCVCVREREGVCL
jgi:hypothetical protein